MNNNKQPKAGDLVGYTAKYADKWLHPDDRFILGVVMSFSLGSDSDVCRVYWGNGRKAWEYADILEVVA
mgnify:CR=1 FL=1